jgi:hypothetical protein
LNRAVERKASEASGIVLFYIKPLPAGAKKKKYGLIYFCVAVMRLILIAFYPRTFPSG